MSVAPPFSQIPDNIGRAIAVVCAAGFTFSLMFTAVKLLDGRYSPFQILLLRYGIGFAISLPWLVRIGRPAIQTHRPLAHVVRAAYGLLSTISLFFAVNHLPLGTVTALSYSMPIFLTALSWPMLGEVVGWRRATATVIGFFGVVIIVDPSSDTNIYAIAAAASAVFYALAAISIRQLSKSETTSCIYVLYNLANIVVCGALMPWFWVAPTMEDWIIFFCIGFLGAAAQLGFLIAYRSAAASIIAPFDYLQILFLILIGYLIWGEIPRTQSLLGGSLIVASGLYIWARERKLAARFNPD